MVEIDKPETKEEWDEIRWKVSHKNVNVVLDNDDDWCVEFLTDCEHLGEGGQCDIYDRRPQICREHEPETCVINGEGNYYQIILKTIEDVEEYLLNNPDALNNNVQTDI